jgi:prephenate dehydrogenase
MTPAQHDRLVARSSHLPHLLASQLVHHTLGRADAAQCALCATGFRDTTRVASGSPEMWRDIAVANASNLAREVARFGRELARLEAVLRRGDGRALERFFRQAKARRDAWCADGGFTSPE